MTAIATASSAATEAQRVWAGPKPRMVFFRIVDRGLPVFVEHHLREHVRCLEQFFDVALVEDDADYDEVVDRVQPEVVLFESGVYARPGRRITNTHRHPEIPKLGFLDADAYCPTRSVFLADMDEWDVGTFFTIALSSASYTPEIADRTFAWPNFADRSVFRTYPGGKAESLLLSGSRASNYPWRVQVDRLLGQRFPVRVLPHGGWFNASLTADMPVGEAYARRLSAAQIVPTCGTIAEDLVRKHLEIPAAGALLLTERTPVVEAAGFVDMETCVFADAVDVVDKVEHLLKNPDVLARISAAGQALAHEEHSIENRDQLRQWVELHRALRPGQRIVQRGPFAPLVVVDEAGTSAGGRFVVPPGRDRILVAKGEEQLRAGDPASAADLFAEVLNLHLEPEAALGLSRSWLAQGRSADARRLLEHSDALLRRAHGATQPDPVEWALLIRTSLCEGDVASAVDRAEQHEGVRHLELDRMRAVVAALTRRPVQQLDRPARLSVHVGFGDQPWGTWSSALVADLRACGQHDRADQVDVLTDPVRQHVPSCARGRGRFSARGGRRLVSRARGRARREWGRLFHPLPAPRRASVFEMTGGRALDVVALVCVEEAVAARFGELVSSDPSAVALVQVGAPAGRRAADAFTPWGWRSGAPASLLDQLPGWGPSLVVVETSGAGLLRHAQLSRTEVLVVVDDLGTGSTQLEHSLGIDAGWRGAEPAFVERVVDALGGVKARVWERVDSWGDDRVGGR